MNRHLENNKISRFKKVLLTGLSLSVVACGFFVPGPSSSATEGADETPATSSINEENDQGQNVSPQWSNDLAKADTSSVDADSGLSVGGEIKGAPIAQPRSRSNSSAVNELSSVPANGTWNYVSNTDQWSIKAVPVALPSEPRKLVSFDVRLETGNKNNFPNDIRNVQLKVAGVSHQAKAQLLHENRSNILRFTLDKPVGFDSFYTGQSLEVSFIAPMEGSKWSNAKAIMRGAAFDFNLVADQPAPLPEVPEIPSGDTAKLRVHVGGLKQGDEIQGLAGAVLRLHRNDNQNYVRPETLANPGPGHYHWGLPGTPINESWAFCTSDAQGWCEFTVPAPEKKRSGGPTGPNYWVKAYKAPEGWNNIDQLRVGFSGGDRGGWWGGGGPSWILDYSYRTPAMYKGMEVSSGLGGESDTIFTSFANNDAFMNNQNDKLDDPVAIKHARASSFYYMYTRDNPQLTQKCGLKLQLLLDVSGSMSGDPLKEYKQRTKDAIKRLRGTGVTLGITEYGDTAKVIMQPRLLDEAGIQDALKAVDAASHRSVGKSTNWDAALRTTIEHNNANPNDKYDAVLMITDGNPTAWLDQGRPWGPLNAANFRVVEKTISTANTVKEQGTRIYGLGVGAFVNSGGADSTYNFSAVAGPNGVVYPATKDDISKLDWFSIPSMSDLTTALSELSITGCQARVTVEKKLDDNGEKKPGGAGWNFSADSLPNGFKYSKGSKNSQTTGEDSTTTFLMDVATPQTKGSLVFGENMTAAQKADGWKLVKQPYSIDSGEGKKTAVCHDKTSDRDVEVRASNVGDTKFRIDNVGFGSHIHCVVENARKTEPENKPMVRITKVDGNGDTLPGAEFILTPGDKKGPTKGAAKIPLTRTSDGISWQSENIEQGTYWIIESKAPEGYSLLPVPIGIEITQSKDGKISSKLINDTDTAIANITVEADLVSIRVEDQVSGGQLPKSGGVGVYPMLAFALVAIGAGTLLGRKETKKAKI